MGDEVENKSFRLFNDPVHGHIELNETCQLIVDTKEFQRLRDIKQLGFVDFVFPGATHTRFEHALGAYHLAGEFVRRLKKYHPKPNATNADEEQDRRDILCIEIAALCHDIEKKKVAVASELLKV
ncbi:deoxynucleoside triphosphate triphosphohydrolase SAMHD1 [Biomphalaria glabrata]|nr:deoxynucleoside triphosphate triphosphohydrolase SAMHD1 [Biomphalaria glabrata]